MTLITIQEKQIAQELAAVAKHGNTANKRSVIFGARTRSRKAIQNLGFDYKQALEAVSDAADIVSLRLNAIKDCD